MYKRFSKRILDIFGAFVLLVLLSPIFMLQVLIFFWLNKGNVFFTQIRPGKDGTPFLLYKFKTMKDEMPGLSEKDRISWIGNIARSTSMDELPQLLNVLKGEMSIIGPRPLLMEYLPLYSENQRKRHTVLPGITGWAQVKGRNSITWTERFELDVYYVEHLSFFLDFKILLLSFYKVVVAKEVYGPNGEIVEKFKGDTAL